MSKKNNDQMFRKAQMKLFTMIVSILLAVFIALISSINVITKAVMRGQSKEVLMQIAAGTEYNDKELKFMFTPPDNGEPRNDRPAEPPKKETEPATTTTETETSAVLTTVTSTTAENTTETGTTTEAEERTEASVEENYDEPEYEQQRPPEVQQPETQPRQPETQPRQPETQPRQPETQQSQENHSDWTAPTVPDNGGNNNGGGWTGGWSGGGQNGWGGGDQSGQSGDQNGQGSWGQGQYDPNWNPYYDPWNPWNPWSPLNPWSPWNQQQWGQAPKAYSNEKENDDFDYESYKKEHGGEVQDNEEEEFTLMQTVYSGEDVLDGFTVLSNKEDGDEVNYESRKDNRKSAPQASPVSASKVEPIPKSLGSIDFFVLMSDKNGNYLAKLYNEDLKADAAQECITDILDKNTDTGMYHSYQYYQADKSNGNLIVLTDKSYEMDMLRQLKRTTIIIGSIAMIILSILAYFLSKKSIQPIKIAFNKQKQFVSDASHELKTPLTVISANSDVLQGEIGENKWLNYIKSQTDRMNVLVNDLLNLTRLENNTVELEYKYFNMSKAIINTALPFECQAFESNKKFEVDVDDNIMLCGSEKHVKQMAAIFIDNALKYSNDGGTVRVSLKKIGGKKVLSVFNTGQGIKIEDQDKIFERFFRSDESRNRATGGYGLGLAIAKSIIDKHKFKLNIINQPGESVCFAVTMQ